MALADTAALVASLELKDQFSKTAANAERALGGLERKTSTLGKVGAEAGRGLGQAAHNLRNVALVGAGLVATQVVAGVKSLTELEEVTNQTGAVIESTGGKADVTADEIRDLSESLENLSTVDDKVIQRGANMLLTFTSIRNEVGEGNDIFDQATETALDMSVALGTDIKDSAIQLGKALNDPIRGVTALRRVGVQFTDQQLDQIKAMTEAGDVMGAQKLILAELNTEFGGSAEAFGKGPGATMRRFADAIEDGQQALARGFLPLIERFSGLAQEAFANPKVIAGIESFGEGLAGGLGQLVDVAMNLPWGAIGDSFTLVGKGAKAALDFFTGLPPWVQTAVLTGWGLNKLTGGALGNIAGILTKGAFGALRGATPANPVFVADVAGGAGVGGGAAAAGGRSLLGTAAKFVLGPAAAIIIGKQIAEAINEPIIGPAKEFEQERVTAVLEGRNTEDMVHALRVIEGQLNTDDIGQQAALIASRIPFIGDALGNAAGTLEAQRDQLRSQLQEQGYTNQQIDAMLAETRTGNALLGITSEAQVGELKSMKADITGDLTTLRATTEAASQHSTQKLSDIKAETMALHNPLRAIEAAGRDSATATRTTASNTAAQLSRIESVERTTAGATQVVANKDFSPRFANTTNVGINASFVVSATSVSRTLQIQQSATQTSFSGRGGDSRF